MPAVAPTTVDIRMPAVPAAGLPFLTQQQQQQQQQQ
eukprot:COSAG03_NODE_303_length_9184_cov_67.131535_4_plen_35_part_01